MNRVGYVLMGLAVAVLVIGGGWLASGLAGVDSIKPMLLAIGVAFIPTQLPLGIFEGLISAGAYRFISHRRPDLLRAIEERVAR